MISILSWNVQNGKGQDGRISLARIADVVVGMGTPDVICLQEISRGLPLGVDAGAPDQIAELFGAVSRIRDRVWRRRRCYLCTNMQGRWQYGNAVADADYRCCSISSHPLYRGRASADKRHMTRQATEVVLETDPAGSLRMSLTFIWSFTASYP